MEKWDEFYHLNNNWLVNKDYKSIYADSLTAINDLTKETFNRYNDENDLIKRSAVGIPINMILVPDKLVNTYKTLGLRVYKVSGLSFVLQSDFENIGDIV